MEVFLFLLSFLFVFGILVFAHEFGHFITAKAFGVEVKEFGFGYPPAIFKKKVGDTTYSLNWVPFGGFVKILGQEGEEVSNPKSFASQRKIIKAIIISAGVLMNLFLAVFIFFFLYTIGFTPLIPEAENHPGVSRNIYVDEVEKNTPAFNGGILKNDKIVKIDNKVVNNISQFQKELKNKAGERVEIEIERKGELKKITVIPYKEGDLVRIGVKIFDLVRSNNILFSLLASFLETFRLSWLTILGIFKFFGKLILTFTLSEEVTGPVGIAVLTNQIRELGFTYLLQFIAILSISLALLNIMPIPALDGGHLFVILIEKISGREFNQVLKNTITIIGFVLLLILIIVITTRDLWRFGIIDNIKKVFGF